MFQQEINIFHHTTQDILAIYQLEPWMSWGLRGFKQSTLIDLRFYITINAKIGNFRYTLSSRYLG